MKTLGLSFLVLLVATTVIVAATNETELVEAAMRGDTAEVRSLLDAGADVNAAYGDGSTALHWAAGNGDLELTRLLLDAGARVDAATRIGSMTPLFMAAKSGEAAVIETLLAVGASANEANDNGTTVLMSAAASGSVEAVGALIEARADVNATEETNGQTALMFAATLNRAEAIKVLIENGADASITTKVSKLPNRGRVGRRSGPAVVGGMTALHFASRDGQMDAVRELVAGGADINAVTGSNKTPPITEAILNANLDIAEFLLDNGADVNIPNGDGLLPLFATLDIQWRQNTWYPQPNVSEERAHYLDLMEEILAHGADVNARLGKRLWYRTFRYSGGWIDPAGATALWRAAEANDVDAMRLLASHGANPTIPTTQGTTPLMVAAGYGFTWQATNIKPDSRIDVLRHLVEELGADVNGKDLQDYTALHGAAYVGDDDAIMYLVARGADVGARASARLGSRAPTPVEPGTGDTVADFANGPHEKSLLFPDTVRLLESLGSENSHDCRSTGCVNNTKEDRPRR